MYGCAVFWALLLKYASRCLLGIPTLIWEILEHVHYPRVCLNMQMYWSVAYIRRDAGHPTVRPWFFVYSGIALFKRSGRWTVWWGAHLTTSMALSGRYLEGQKIKKRTWWQCPWLNQQVPRGSQARSQHISQKKKHWLNSITIGSINSLFFFYKYTSKLFGLRLNIMTPQIITENSPLLRILRAQQILHDSRIQYNQFLPSRQAVYSYDHFLHIPPFK